MTASLLKKHLARIGSKGGKSKSPVKLKAISRNLAKANANRWPKKNGSRSLD